MTTGHRRRVVVLGAGFGGLEVATSLCEQAPGEVDVVLVDRADGFVFGFSKLDVMFRGVAPAHALHRYEDLQRPGLTFLRASILSIDPANRTVSTLEGDLEADVLVVALGADVHPEATPGLVEGGHEFYSVPGAVRCADAIADFRGGHVVVGVTSTPFKCPPAPSEAALLAHEHLAVHGLLDLLRRVTRHAAPRAHPSVAGSVRDGAVHFRLPWHRLAPTAARAGGRQCLGTAGSQRR